MPAGEGGAGRVEQHRTEPVGQVRGDGHGAGQAVPAGAGGLGRHAVGDGAGDAVAVYGRTDAAQRRDPECEAELAADLVHRGGRTGFLRWRRADHQVGGQGDQRAGAEVHQREPDSQRS